jgi:hypothetical protein
MYSLINKRQISIKSNNVFLLKKINNAIYFRISFNKMQNKEKSKLRDHVWSKIATLLAPKKVFWGAGMHLCSYNKLEF